MKTVAVALRFFVTYMSLTTTLGTFGILKSVINPFNFIPSFRPRIKYFTTSANYVPSYDSFSSNYFSLYPSGYSLSSYPSAYEQATLENPDASTLSSLASSDFASDKYSPLSNAFAAREVATLSSLPNSNVKTPYFKSSSYELDDGIYKQNVGAFGQFPGSYVQTQPDIDLLPQTQRDYGQSKLNIAFTQAQKGYDQTQPDLGVFAQEQGDYFEKQKNLGYTAQSPEKYGQNHFNIPALTQIQRDYGQSKINVGEFTQAQVGYDQTQPDLGVLAQAQSDYDQKQSIGYVAQSQEEYGQSQPNIAALAQIQRDYGQSKINVGDFTQAQVGYDQAQPDLGVSAPAQSDYDQKQSIGYVAQSQEEYGQSQPNIAALTQIQRGYGHNQADLAILNPSKEDYGQNQKGVAILDQNQVNKLALAKAGSYGQTEADILSFAQTQADYGRLQASVAALTEAEMGRRQKHPAIYQNVYHLVQNQAELDEIQENNGESLPLSKVQKSYHQEQPNYQQYYIPSNLKTSEGRYNKKFEITENEPIVAFPGPVTVSSNEEYTNSAFVPVTKHQAFFNTGPVNSQSASSLKVRDFQHTLTNSESNNNVDIAYYPESSDDSNAELITSTKSDSSEIPEHSESVDFQRIPSYSTQLNTEGLDKNFGAFETTSTSKEDFFRQSSSITEIHEKENSPVFIPINQLLSLEGMDLQNPEVLERLLTFAQNHGYKLEKMGDKVAIPLDLLDSLNNLDQKDIHRFLEQQQLSGFQASEEQQIETVPSSIAS